MTPSIPLYSSTTATPASIEQQHDWTTLPLSVLHAIISHIHSPSSATTLPSLALTCKQFAAATRAFLFATITLKSSSRCKDVARLEDLHNSLTDNPRLVEGTERLRLELDNGHRWIFSRILTPPFRTEDPAAYDELRKKRVELDRVLSSILLRISGRPDTPTTPAYTRCLRIFELSHYTFYPISRDVEVMQGWQSVFAMDTLEVVRMSDVLDFPLALLGYAGEGVKEVGLLRVKLDRRDTEHAWSQDVTKENKRKGLKPRVLSIRDCYPETVDPLIACAMNPNTFLHFSEVEELTVHPCLAVQAPAYNKLVNAVIAHSEVLNHLTWMSSGECKYFFKASVEGLTRVFVTAQHQVNDLDALSAADFTRFKKVDLVFDDGFSGFPQLLVDIRDLLRAASNVFRTAPPSPNLAQHSEEHHLTSLFPVGELLSVDSTYKNKRRVTSSLEELNLKFDVENLTMQSRPESTMSCPDPTVGIHYHEGDREYGHLTDTQASIPESVYYAHIKYIWRLNELDMEVLKEIDSMLSGASSSGEGMQLDGGIGHAQNHAFPHFKRLATTCTFNPSSSFLLDEEKAMGVYEACKEFVQRGLPRLQESAVLRFAFEKA